MRELVSKLADQILTQQSMFGVIQSEETLAMPEILQEADVEDKCQWLPPPFWCSKERISARHVLFDLASAVRLGKRDLKRYVGRCWLFLLSVLD